MSSNLTRERQPGTLCSLEIQQSLLKEPPIRAGSRIYVEEPYRFCNAVIFCLSGLANSFIAQSLSPISVQVQQYCDASELEVDMCALVFMLVHPFMTFLANYILNRWGLKIGVSINCVLVIIGLVMRCFVKLSFSYVLAGNTIIAFGNAFILNSPAQFSANWFRASARLLMTSIAVFAMVVSGGAGALISPFVVRQNMGQQAGLEAVFKLMIYQGGPIALVMLINLAFFRGKPKYPPAPSGDQQRDEFGPSLKKLVQNRNYVLLFFSMMCILGTSNSFAVTIEDFLIPFGISSIQSGIGLALTVVMGLAGCVISSLYSNSWLYAVKKTQAYTRIIKAEMAIGIASMAGIALPLLWHILPLFWVLVCALGFFIYPVIPGIIELGCEVVFPVGQPLSTGFLLAGGSIFGFLLGVAQTNVIKGQNKTQSIIGGCIYVAVFSIGLILFLFVRQDLRRIDFQQQALNNSLITDGHQEGH